MPRNIFFGIFSCPSDFAYCIDFVEELQSEPYHLTVLVKENNLPELLDPLEGVRILEDDEVSVPLNGPLLVVEDTTLTVAVVLVVVGRGLIEEHRIHVVPRARALQREEKVIWLVLVRADAHIALVVFVVLLLGFLRGLLVVYTTPHDEPLLALVDDAEHDAEAAEPLLRHRVHRVDAAHLLDEERLQVIIVDADIAVPARDVAEPLVDDILLLDGEPVFDNLIP